MYVEQTLNTLDYVLLKKKSWEYISGKFIHNTWFYWSQLDSYERISIVLCNDSWVCILIILLESTCESNLSHWWSRDLENDHWLSSFRSTSDQQSLRIFMSHQLFPDSEHIMIQVHSESWVSFIFNESWQDEWQYIMINSQRDLSLELMFWPFNFI